MDKDEQLLAYEKVKLAALGIFITGWALVITYLAATTPPTVGMLGVVLEMVTVPLLLTSSILEWRART
jgi:hypothetical protein